MDPHRHHVVDQSHRLPALAIALAGFVVPFVVLLLSGTAEQSMRAFYAVGLCGLILWGGAWVAFRAEPDQLAKPWTPEAFRPSWAMVMRLCGLLVIVAGAVLLTSTIQDVYELVSAGRPKTFVEEARGVQGKVILHPFFQTVRLRGDGSYRKVYMFAYGGKKLVDGRRYVITVLPRSHWILSARQEIEIAGQKLLR